MYIRDTKNLPEETGEFSLEVVNATLEDDAIYECQVGPSFNNKPIRASSRLNVMRKLIFMFYRTILTCCVYKRQKKSSNPFWIFFHEKKHGFTDARSIVWLLACKNSEPMIMRIKQRKTPKWTWRFPVSVIYTVHTTC